jgi:hypothetical protein
MSKKFIAADRGVYNHNDELIAKVDRMTFPSTKEGVDMAKRIAALLTAADGMTTEEAVSLLNGTHLGGE